MSKKSVPTSPAVRKRPTLISIVAILGFIWISFSFPGVFSPSVKKLGDWYPAIFGMLVAANFISFIGLWNMKRWSVELFVCIFFTKQLLLIHVNDISYVGLVFSVFFISSMLLYYKRMDKNL